MNRKGLIAALATVLGLGFLALREMESNKVYSYSVADFVKRDLRDRRARVQGTLVPGTLCRMDDCGFRFTLKEPAWSYAGAAASPKPWPTLPVSFAGCAILEPFLAQPERDHQVVVFGQRCRACHEFQATDVLTRSYEYQGGAGAVPPLPLPPRCTELSPRM
jgi:hypothetical protein